MSAKSLIVTADDFGYSSAVNEAVIRAYREGVLTHASLMVDRPAAAEAARLARENPGLGVGLHLELCADRPAVWGARYFFSPSDRARVAPEIERQLDKMTELGVKEPTHVDGHLNIHVHPVIFPALCRLSASRRIPRVRLPSGELGPCRAFGAAGPLAYVNALVFGAMKRWLTRSSAGLSVPPRTWGLLRSGLMSEDYLVALIDALPEGETEIYLHPSAEEGTEAVDRPTPTHQSISELRSLLSPRVKAALERSRARLRKRASSAG